MARVELPSLRDGSETEHNWVEYREQLKASDRFAVQDAIFIDSKDGNNRMSLGIGNDIRNALLGRIITAWSFTGPTPSQIKDVAAADVIIGDTMDLDDYNALSDAVQPLVDKVQGTAKKKELKADPKSTPVN
jgi:hypothetical protein